MYEQSKNPTPEKREEFLKLYFVTLPSDYMQEKSSPEYEPTSPVYVPEQFTEYPADDSPEYIPNQKGGYANIFSEPLKNDAFNQLPSDKQSIILQMSDDERENIMNKIIKETSLQKNLRNVINEEPTNSTNSTNILTDYFNRLPPSNQIAALKGGYTCSNKRYR